MGERYDSARSYRVPNKPEGAQNGMIDSHGNKVISVYSPDHGVSYIVYEPIDRKQAVVSDIQSNGGQAKESRI